MAENSSCPFNGWLLALVLKRFGLKNIDRLLYLLLGLLFIPGPGQPDALAEDAARPLKLQLMAGQMVIANDDPQVSGGDYDITLVGVAAQKPFWGKWAQAGIEMGALFNWKTETRSYFVSGGGGGGTAAISADITQFLFDYFFGGYASLEPVKWLRLYAGAGPLLIIGSRTTEETDPATSETEEKSESDFSAGVYGRGGIDIIFSKNFMLGAGARYTQTGLSFSGPAGKLDVKGWQYFGIITFRF
jgi:hypothetical protein